MLSLLWDASALAKRYTPEPGSDTVDALFAEADGTMVLTIPGYCEVYAILRRHRNAGRLTEASLAVARTAMQEEIIEGFRFQVIALDDASHFAGLFLIDRHNLNSADSAILAAYLDYQISLLLFNSPCVLVASDHRLLRAASSEGLRTLDPEALAANAVPSFLNNL